MPSEFRNEPFTDFDDPHNVQAFQEALEQVRSEFGKTHPMVIGGREVTVGNTYASVDPSRPSVELGHFQNGDASHADAAIEAASAAFQTWSTVPAAKRAEYLFQAAARMRARKHYFSAWMVYEVGKSWPEADGDTAEAIDFLEYYGREMLRYADKQPVTPVGGESNELVYIPLGVGAIIPPWNFPNAILLGMTSAAIVTGNTVVVKPAGDSPVIAWHVFQLLREVGIPDGVVNFVTGPGHLVGNRMVEHPRTRFITFTGSMEVGLGINAKAAVTQPGQIWIKRVIVEMGGKDSIVLDAEGDVDAAVEGVATSAFGYSGQKCSACSRAIVDASGYDTFVEKLVARCKDIRVGHPEDPATEMGPVVFGAAQKKILVYVRQGQESGRTVLGGQPWSGDGFFVPPTIIADVPVDAVISKEEIFGPVLAVIKARDWQHALRIANNTQYGLTGAVYTRNDAKIQEAKQAYHVGNLYFNRGCTGALVGVHPFGGFNMSGTDSKAGGRD
jgi:1-pyrroline-5-carboxylate dehydrogenase